MIGPSKLAPEGGPGPGGQSKGTWTLVLARPHGVNKVARSGQIILPGALQLLSNRHMKSRLAHVHERVLLLRSVELLTPITSDLPMKHGTRNTRLTTRN